MHTIISDTDHFPKCKVGIRVGMVGFHHTWRATVLIKLLTFLLRTATMKKVQLTASNSQECNKQQKSHLIRLTMKIKMIMIIKEKILIQDSMKI
jgi:hypothetical protein